MEVSKEEVNAARDAIVAHAEKHGRTHAEALLVFEETVRQLKEYLESLEDIPLH